MKKTMTLYLTKNVEYDIESVFALDRLEYLPDNHVVIAKPLEVEFELLTEQDLTEKRVAIIDKEISKVRANLHQLEQQKQELLSLPAPE